MLLSNRSNVASWLDSEVSTMLPARLLIPQQATFAGRCLLSTRLLPLYPQQPTFECRSPLFGEIRPLHPQQQTFLVVSPKVRS